VSGGSSIPLGLGHLTGAALLAVGVAVAGCGTAGQAAAGGGSTQFRVAITSARFPSSQRLSAHTHMVIAVRNAGSSTIPNIAATVCNVTCAYPASPGAGTSAAAFASNISGTDVGNPSRPIWIVDRAPGPCQASCGGGGPGSAVTAYANTWALGSLAPGQTKVFAWTVTAVSPGRHTVAWVIAAGLDSGTRAELADGSTPQGTFTVTIHTKPAQSYVSGSGQIVNLP
jgi:hypothetical protein